MRRHDSESPLSFMADTDIDDSVVGDHDHDHDQEELHVPPAKRLKTRNVDSTASSAIMPRDEPAPEEEHKMTHLQVSDVSSDTSGSVPSSPQYYPAGRLEVEDDILEQVTVCAWDRCHAGDLGNMDELVKHIHNVHITDLQQAGLYTCEWIGCNRKGKKHASGYALKAHIRSHTREKPFYCYLPGMFTSHFSSLLQVFWHLSRLTHLVECDRSFTRSDALAKHMRTVHETEALRPSDPVPKSMQPGGGQPGPNYATVPPLGTPSNGTSKRLKIVLKTPSHTAAAANTSADDSVATDDEHHQVATEDDWQFTPLTEEAGFNPQEIDMAKTGNLERLHRLCRAQLHWANEESEQLRGELAEVEKTYWKEWRAKEALLKQVVGSEMDWDTRRQAVLAGRADAEFAAAAAAASAAAATTTSNDNGGEPTEQENESPAAGDGGDGRAKEKRILSVPPLRDPPRPRGSGLMQPQRVAATRGSGGSVRGRGGGRVALNGRAAGEDEEDDI